MKISSGQAAFATTIVGAGITAASVALAVTSVSTISLVAFSALAITAAGATAAVITAWISTSKGTSGEFFKAWKHHAAIGVAASFQFVTQTLIQALIKGFADSIVTLIGRKLRGEDVTIKTA